MLLSQEEQLWPVQIMAKNNTYKLYVLRDPYQNGDCVSVELVQSYNGVKRQNYRRVVLDYK
jgi:hypothetical protein